MKHTFYVELPNHDSKPVTGVELLQMGDAELAEFLSGVLPQLMDGTLDPDIAGRSPDIYIANLLKGRLGDFSKRICLVAKEQHLTVGVLIALPDREERMHVYTVGVLPTHRGKGVGTSLLRDLFSRLQCTEYNHVVLEVHDKNTPAKTLFSRLGFK